MLNLMHCHGTCRFVAPIAITMLSGIRSSVAHSLHANIFDTLPPFGRQLNAETCIRTLNALRQ